MYFKLVPPEWHMKKDGVELAVYAYKPLTTFMEVDDHLRACLKYMLARLFELNKLIVN